MLNFDVIKEFLKEKNKIGLKSDNYDSLFCFIDLLKLKLRKFLKTGRKVPEDKKLLQLLNAYPINYSEFYKSIIA